MGRWPVLAGFCVHPSLHVCCMGRESLPSVMLRAAFLHQCSLPPIHTCTPSCSLVQGGQGRDLLQNGQGEAGLVSQTLRQALPLAQVPSPLHALPWPASQALLHGRASLVSYCQLNPQGPLTLPYPTLLPNCCNHTGPIKSPAPPVGEFLASFVSFCIRLGWTSSQHRTQQHADKRQMHATQPAPQPNWLVLPRHTGR